MSELSVLAISAVFQEHPDYRPVPVSAASAENEGVAQLARAVAEFTGVPAERLRMLADADVQAATQVGGHALAALGAPAEEQPLFLVRSGPLLDPYSAELARLVHESGWAGEDVGITHLDELGGTAVFGLLNWALPEQAEATVLVCDDPLFVDELDGRAPIGVVGLRVLHGPGPLRVLGCGEGVPEPGLLGEADHRFLGTRPCDGWRALHAMLAAGRIDDGDRILLHTRGPRREGWLALEAVDVAAPRLTDAGFIELATEY